MLISVTIYAIKFRRNHNMLRCKAQKLIKYIFFHFLIKIRFHLAIMDKLDDKDDIRKVFDKNAARRRPVSSLRLIEMNIFRDITSHVVGMAIRL